MNRAQHRMTSWKVPIGDNQHADTHGHNVEDVTRPPTRVAWYAAGEMPEHGPKDDNDVGVAVHGAPPSNQISEKSYLL